MRLKSLFLVFVLLGVARFAMEPEPFRSRIYHVGGEYQDDYERAEFPEGQKSAFVTYGVFRTALSPTRYSILADDCVSGIIVNGEPVQRESFPACDYPNARDFDLSEGLREGMNTVVVQIANHGGGGLSVLRIGMSDWRVRTFTLLLFLSTVIAVYFVVPLSGVLRQIVILGVLLRISYGVSTAEWERNYDWAGHRDYTSRMVSSFAVPAAESCWQCFQPPLYYAVNAAAVRTMQLFIPEGGNARLVIGGISIALSLVLFAVCLHLGEEVLGENSPTRIFLWYLFVATYPGFVMLSSRLNNDALVQPLIAAALVASVRWWNHGEDRYWNRAAALIALGALTKANALVLLPILIGMLICRPARTGKVRKLLTLTGICAVACLPYYVWRYAGDDFQTLARIGDLDQTLQLTTEVEQFTSFSPLDVIREPFTDSRDDRFRRYYFWEYLLHTAFFGEFQHPPITKLAGSVIMLFAILLIPLVFGGVIFAFRRDATGEVPAAIAFISMIASVLFFRIRNPFSCAQDFRYIPIAALLGLSLALCWRPRWIGTVGAAVTACLCAAQTWFVVSLVRTTGLW